MTACSPVSTTGRSAGANFIRLPFAIVLIPILALTIAGCARQTRTAMPEPVIDIPAIEAARSGIARISEFKGFGEITLVTGGQRASGNIDAARRNTGYVKAQIYSPFGSAIAAINASDFEGRISVGKEAFDFTYDNKMTDVPFPCVKRFTYGAFINNLTASMPDVFWELPAAPDTLIRSKKRKTATAAWISDTLTVRAQMSPRTAQFDAVTFNYDFGGDKFSMRFGKFKKGAPTEILVKEGSKNYISVTYENIVWK